MRKTVDFSDDDVAAEAGVDPWELYDEFREELDPDAIWEAAKTYESAASEAANVTEFADLATQQNVDAADYSGTSLSNAESRLESTMGDIDNGALEATVGSLHRVVAAASDAQSDNYDEMFGADALRTKVNDHKADARNELDAWYDQLDAAIENYNSRTLYRLTNPAPRINAPGDAEASGFAWGGSVYAEMDGNTANVPDSVVESIRQHYLEKAASDAKDTHGRLEDNIEGYRSTATNEAAELDGNGYDLGNSELDIWYTPGMAEYHAQEIQRSLEVLEENPDDIDALTNVRETMFMMGVVTGDLYDGIEVNRKLEDNEFDYLNTFFNALSGDDLATFGNLEPSGSDSALEEPWKNLANGVHALTDPDVGGVEPNEEEDLPDSVSEYLFGYPDYLDDQRVWHAPTNVEGEQEAIDRFGGFSHLMSHADIPPGDTMAELQFDAATGVQAHVDERNDSRVSGHNESVQDLLLNPHGGGLLDAVALNTSASTEILSDEDNRDALMGSYWEDSNPAGKVLTSALVPEDGENLSATQKEIADYFIKESSKGTDPESEDPVQFIPEWDEDYDPDKDPHPSYDSTGLQRAVGNAGIMRMDDVLSWDSDSSDGYSETERQAFFTLMAAGDEDVYQAFKADVFTLQQDHAQEVFTGQGVNDISQVELEYVAMLTDGLGHGEREVLTHYGEREDEKAEQEQKFRRAAAGAAIIGASGVTTALAVPAAPVAAAGWTYATAALSGGIAGNTLVQSMLPDYEAKLPDTLDNYQASEAFMNEQMAYMAILNGAAAADGVDGIDTSEVDFEELFDGSSDSHGNIPEPDQGRVPNPQARDLEIELGFESSVREHASGAGYGEEDNRN